MWRRNSVGARDLARARGGGRHDPLLRRGHTPHRKSVKSLLSRRLFSLRIPLCHFYSGFERFWENHGLETRSIHSCFIFYLSSFLHSARTAYLCIIIHLQFPQDMEKFLKSKYLTRTYWKKQIILHELKAFYISYKGIKFVLLCLLKVHVVWHVLL